MDVVVIVDALEELRPETDTSVGLMHAAQEMGAQVWVTTPNGLGVDTNGVWAVARPVQLMPSRPSEGGTWTVSDPWLIQGATARIDLDDVAAIFMWVEPPLNESYLTASFVLDLVRNTPVVNSPAGIRACCEHLLPLHFPDLVPPTIVSSNPTEILEFVAAERMAVLKPVDGHAGHGVYLLRYEDPNLPSLLETTTERGRQAVIVQRHLQEVDEGNKRIFVLDGDPVGAVHRFPVPGDFRIGEPSEVAPITDSDRRICARLAPVLAAHGLRVAGLDVIGTSLIEVNLTSPGALRKADSLLGWTLCGEVVAATLATPARRAS